MPPGPRQLPRGPCGFSLGPPPAPRRPTLATRPFLPSRLKGASPHLPGVQLPLNERASRTPRLRHPAPTARAAPLHTAAPHRGSAPQAQLTQSLIGSATDRRRGSVHGLMGLRIVQALVRSPAGRCGSLVPCDGGG
ncbi:hypothetical protein NDU88_006576 [Pleurodeles waltl]|uniref:Uncharacterized protein n=1 Tax=Pleurodeles waltl TaxID=8319 RepID=A0AAV7PLD9_PLEWA|nr:hypothetical protein NDU88_006576 [Pleurodeles waltl]